MEEEGKGEGAAGAKDGEGERDRATEEAGARGCSSS